MSLRSTVPRLGADGAIDADSSYSWHTDHSLVAFAARSGVFWSATLRTGATGETPEIRGTSQPEVAPAGSAPAVDLSPADGPVAGAAGHAAQTATVEPLVMASLCNLLYDATGQPSKTSWTPDQWDAALQQDTSTASWQFLGKSSVDPQAYFGVAFENSDTGQIVIANRGSETGYDLLVSDIDILRGTVPPAFLAAEQFACQITTAYQGSGRQVLVTGHSLGGADAEYQAAKLGLGGDTFAALGARFAAAGSAPNLVNYLFPQDAVANLAPHIGPVAYIEPNGPAQWLDLLATRQYSGEGLHFINNYLEHFGASGITPITPTQFVEAIVLADVAQFFSGNEDAAAMRLSGATNDFPAAAAGNGLFGFAELAVPGMAVVASPGPNATTVGAGASDWALATVLLSTPLSAASPIHPG